MEKKVVKIKGNTLSAGVNTSKGALKAVVSNDENYPGLLLYLGEELYGAIELYEEEQELRLRAYNDVEDEPILTQVLKQF